MINIILIDDHELVRTGFKMILQQQPDMRVQGEAGTAEEGLRLIRSYPAAAIDLVPRVIHITG